MRFQLNLTLLLIMNHSEVTQTSKRTVNTKVTIETKVQHEHCIMTNLIMISLLLNNKLCIIYSITEEKTIWESSIKKVTIITTKIFSESSLLHQHKNFITKNKIDVWRKISLYIKCEVTDYWMNECITEWLTAVTAAIKVN